MISTIHAQIQKSPFKNVYWFARYLLNTDKFGALGKSKENQLLEVSLMKKFFLMAFVFTFISINVDVSQVFATEGMKLYRNREYQFSIEIPEYLQYQKPRGPNVKMTAAVRDFNMNIVIRPVPEIDYSTDEILAAMYLNDLELFKNNDTHIIEADIINIPHTRVLYYHYLARFDYPRGTFFLTGYCFQFIRHHRLYCITYCVEPGKENLYKETIIDSIGSFVDEAGWY